MIARIIDKMQNSKKGGTELSTSTIIVLVLLVLLLVVVVFIAVGAFGGFGKDIMSKIRIALGFWNNSMSGLPK